MSKVELRARLGGPRLVAILIFAFAMTVFLWGSGLHASWWIVDDEEIQQFIGPAQRMPLSKLMPNLLDTEVGQAGTYLRFRPGYYLVRLLECAFWGKDPHLWYGVRAACFFLALSILIALLDRFMGFPLAMALTLLFLCHAFWADVFARLGPAETYAAIGLPLYCLAFVIIKRRLGQTPPDDASQTKSAFVWTLIICIASLLTAGSKENFTLILIPSAYLLYLALKSHGSRSAVRVVTIAALSLNLLIPVTIIATVSLALARARHDIYLNPVSPGERVLALAHFPTGRSAAAEYCLLLGVTLLVTIAAVAAPRLAWLDSDRCRLINRAMYTQLTLTGLYFSQLLFYDGRWPTGTRYDYPGALIPEISLALSIYLASQVARRHLAVPIRITGSLLLCCLAFHQRGELVRNRELSKANVTRTQQFTSRLQLVIREASAHPQRPIVLESHSVWDYEPVVSVRCFLRINNIANPIQLKVIGYSAAVYPNHSLEAALAKQMDVLSRSGDPENDFAPLQRETNDVFTVGLSGEPSGEPRHAICRIF
jgi:hypothetical protein